MSRIPTTIERSAGMHISRICPHKISTWIDPQDGRPANHCAHYVSHIMGYDSIPGPDGRVAHCKNRFWTPPAMRVVGHANIRVNDLFNACPSTGLLNDKPADLTECLIFVTIERNLQSTADGFSMGSKQYKHIGILKTGNVWHYSNTGQRVVFQPTAEFVTTFTDADGYSSRDPIFLYGEFI